MATFTEIVAQIQRRCANHTLLTNTIAGEMANSAHADLIESHEWSRRRKEILILTAAQTSSGTVAVTNGSPNVTGTSTAFAATDVGKYIRIGTDDALYVVRTRTSATAITLGDQNGTAANYAGSTSTSTTYVIFQRWYSLGVGIEAIDVVSYKDKLTELTTDRLDVGDPVRSVSGDPLCFARGPRDSNAYPQGEFWPRPTGTIAGRFNVILGHTDLSGTNTPIVPTPVVVVKASVLSCYFIFSKDKDDRWLQLAARYDKEFDRVFELQKRLDEAKFGVPRYIRDVGEGGLRGTDWALDHDVF